MLQSVSSKKHKIVINDMLDQMGGEYVRFRLENLLVKDSLADLLKQKKVTIKSKLTHSHKERLR